MKTTNIQNLVAQIQNLRTKQMEACKIDDRKSIEKIADQIEELQKQIWSQKKQNGLCSIKNGLC